MKLPSLQCLLLLVSAASATVATMLSETDCTKDSDCPGTDNYCMDGQGKTAPFNCHTAVAPPSPPPSPPSSPAPPQFPGSRIATVANWGGLLDAADHPDGYPPLPGSGQTKTLNGWAEKPETQVWALCYSSFTDNNANPATFHKQCDKYNTTMVFAKNSLNFTFGGYATTSWDADVCCAKSGNTCDPPHAFGKCYENHATSNFIFRLEQNGKPAMQIFRTGNNCWNCDDPSEYQVLGPNMWPQWGHFDLQIGGPPGGGRPGTFGDCVQGGAYAGYEDNCCGGDNNWGHTDLEVWYPVETPKPAPKPAPKPSPPAPKPGVFIFYRADGPDCAGAVVARTGKIGHGLDTAGSCGISVEGIGMGGGEDGGMVEALGCDSCGNLKSYRYGRYLNTSDPAAVHSRMEDCEMGNEASYHVVLLWPRNQNECKLDGYNRTGTVYTKAVWTCPFPTVPCT